MHVQDVPGAIILCVNCFSKLHGPVALMEALGHAW
jgi:hypothetical protein